MKKYVQLFISIAILISCSKKKPFFVSVKDQNDSTYRALVLPPMDNNDSVRIGKTITIELVAGGWHYDCPQNTRSFYKQVSGKITEVQYYED